MEHSETCAAVEPGLKNKKEDGIKMETVIGAKQETVDVCLSSKAPHKSIAQLILDLNPWPSLDTEVQEADKSGRSSIYKL